MHNKDSFFQRVTGRWREAHETTEASGSAPPAPWLPIDRPSVIEDQSLPFCEVLSVTRIELKPRP